MNACSYLKRSDWWSRASARSMSDITTTAPSVSWQDCDNDTALLHQLFPVTAERPYFAHAGVAPIGGSASSSLTHNTPTMPVPTIRRPAGSGNKFHVPAKHVADLLGTTADTLVHWPHRGRPWHRRPGLSLAGRRRRSVPCRRLPGQRLSMA